MFALQLHGAHSAHCAPGGYNMVEEKMRTTRRIEMVFSFYEQSLGCVTNAILYTLYANVRKIAMHKCSVA